MTGIANRLQNFSDTVERVPVVGVFWLAIRKYVFHQSANQAGSMAFSSVLSMFPLLILLSAAASYIGKPGDAAILANRVLEYAPQLVRESLQPIVRQVLAQRSQALLAIGLFVTLWTATSGMQAVRTALNKAYGVEHGLSFWRARLKVTLFTVVVGSAVLLAFSSVVVMPRLTALIEANSSYSEAMFLKDGVRYAFAYFTLALLYGLMYTSLTDTKQQWRFVVPGALVGAALWVVAAGMLSYTLRTAGKLALFYGSFAGVVATLVFLYFSASTLIFGAELNAAVREKREKKAKRENEEPGNNNEANTSEFNSLS